LNKIINGNVTIGIEKEKNVNRRKSEKIEEEMFQKLARNRTKRTQAKRGRQKYCCFDQTVA